MNYLVNLSDLIVQCWFIIVSNNETHLILKVIYSVVIKPVLMTTSTCSYGQFSSPLKTILRPYQADVDLGLHVDLASLIGPLVSSPPKHYYPSVSRVFLRKIKNVKE